MPRRIVASMRGAGGSFALLGGVLVALSCSGVSDEELTCEHAVSRITECCPHIDGRQLPCVDTAGGCASGEAEATLTRGAGDCVLELSCDALRSSGKCDRIRAYAETPHLHKDRVAFETEVCQ